MMGNATVVFACGCCCCGRVGGAVVNVSSDLIVMEVSMFVVVDEAVLIFGVEVAVVGEES